MVVPVNRLETVRRYLILFAGIFFIALGVSMFTKSNLGTSAISVIPLTLSMKFTLLSYGTWVALFNIALVGAQRVMLGSDMPMREIVQQLLFAMVFGSIIDFTMFLLTYFNPQAYWQCLLTVVVSCFVLAFGVYLTLISRVGVMAGDGFARAISTVSGKSFAFVRVCSDSIMVLIAVVLCLVWFGALLAVREGTVIAALVCGAIVGFYTKHLKRVEYALLPFNATVDAAQVAGLHVVDEDFENSPIR